MTKKLYVLTDDKFTPDEIVRDAVREIVACGVEFVQYRSKKPKLDEKVISDLIAICDTFGAKLILNDNPALASKLGAHGVHIGKDDGDLQTALKLMRGKIVGVSCYGDTNRAIMAQNLGASYVAFGAVFKSPTKKSATLCDLDKIEFEKIKIPSCLIGGINANNLASLKSIPAQMIAVISAAYEPGSITQNLQNLQKILKG